jgi:hypothetical protein
MRTALLARILYQLRQGGPFSRIEDHTADARAGQLRPQPLAPSCCLLRPILAFQCPTTQTVTGSVIGVGAARKVSAVRWNALMAAVFYARYQGLSCNLRLAYY